MLALPSSEIKHPNTINIDVISEILQFILVNPRVQENEPQQLNFRLIARRQI